MHVLGMGTQQGYPTITLNPMPDATPADFERQLRGSGVLASLLVGVEHHESGTVTVTLTDMGRAKSALRAVSHLPRFMYLLPEN